MSENFYQCKNCKITVKSYGSRCPGCGLVIIGVERGRSSFRQELNFPVYWILLGLTAKRLVVVQTAISLIFMTWAVMIYLQFNDFGWKEPFKVWESKAEGSASGYRVPSVLDKRTAVLHELYRQTERVVPDIQPTLDTLTTTMEFFPKNHQFYVTELETLRNSDKDIAPKVLQWNDGQLILESKDIAPGGKVVKAAKGETPLGKPLMGGPVKGITKSTKTTTLERDKILVDVEKITAELAELIKAADEITIQLHGTKDDKGNSLDIGLYEVLHEEHKNQTKIREEIDYITPLFVSAQRRTDGFRDRRAGMERTLTKLRK